MSLTEQKRMSTVASYTDRFGHTWSIREQRGRGKPKCWVFTCGELKLVTEGPVPSPAERSDSDIKEIFCDAERVVVHEDRTWFVGYRTRGAGRGGRQQSGLCTRFRSDEGEVRYARTMLHFRHMPEETLRKYIAKARAGKI